MRIIVQKFGGTSVATDSRRSNVVDKVVGAIELGYSPVVVVSAIGRKGDPYATDTLLSLLNDSVFDIDRRETDLLMCCGEIISAVVMTEAFARRGYKARVLTGGNAGIITDDNFGNARVINVETDRILEILNQGIIPIVTGFQGMTEEGAYTTLGRGGSDVTGALLGKALKAEFIEIYTDVDGIMTADPRIVPNARVINEISYTEVFQFADQGAKVVHPRAVEYAMLGNVPLMVKNTSSDSPGTIITISSQGSRNTFTGITHKNNRTQITIDSAKSINRMGRDVFDTLAEMKICVELINVSPHQIVFTLDSKYSEAVKKVLEESNLNCKIINNCSKIAILENRMWEIPGVMAKVLQTLDKNNIDVLQTADSHTTIWCLIREEDTIRAINALHDTFIN